MELRKVLALRGPNIWANYPVLEAWVDLGHFEYRPSNSIEGFNDRLMAWLPTMIEHRCTLGVRGGFFERLRRGTWLGHVLEHVTLELQSLAGTVVGFGRARETAEVGVYRVVVEYLEEDLGRECLTTAHRLLMAAVHNQPFDVDAEIRRLRAFKQQICLGPSTGGIVDSAKARGIPVRRLTSGSLVQLGYGSKQRRICAAETDRTSAIAQEIAQDKELTRKLLRAAGVNVPDGRPVTSAEDAWEAASDIGLPVVVKPQDGNQGRGVATNLSTREQVIGAYEAASRESKNILVEQYIPGNDYRLLVVNGRVVAAARREPAQVVGDGQHTVAELVAQVNADPRRGEDHSTALSKIPLDAVSLGVLADQGFTTDSVPPAGKTVLIRRNANLSTGGRAVDVTDRVHPEVAARAIDAARMVGLDIAGVDVVAQDISTTLEEQHGAIVEVNAAPGLRMHLEPSFGVARPVTEAIVEMLFPNGDNGRIPLAAVTGVNGKTTTVRLIAHMLRAVHQHVGMTCTDGIYFNDRRIDREDCSGPQSAQNVLMNPLVDAAVLETARGGILRAGLGFDLCDVAVVTNIGEGDHLGLSDVGDLEALAKVKRCIVEVLQPNGTAVLNAADPLVAGMAARSTGKVTFFAYSGDEPVIQKHRAEGGRAVFVRDNHVVLAEGPREETLISLESVPLTRGGKIRFQVENVLAAVAAGLGLGIAKDTIRERLESFVPNLQHSPGRFNLFEIGGASVVVDYGHNPSALQAVIEAMNPLPGKRTAVFTAAGDRRDCDMIRQGQIVGAAFDRIVLYEDHYRRGRPDGQITSLIRQGLAGAARTTEILEVPGFFKAIDTALDLVQPGEVLLIQADTIDETIDYVRRYMAEHERTEEPADETVSTTTPPSAPEAAEPSPVARA
jgi:cyanophycin synthetase